MLGVWASAGRFGWLVSAIVGFGLGSLVWLAAHRNRAPAIQLIAALCALLMVALGLLVSLLHGPAGWHGFGAKEFTEQASGIRPERVVISAAAAVLGALYRFWR